MINWTPLVTRANNTFTPAQIKAAVAAVQAMPNKDGYIKPLWPKADKMAKISQIDFGDAEESDTNLSDLYASTKRMRIDKLIAHIKMCQTAPGSAMRDNPFTQYPMTVRDENGCVTILDGHHRLGALKILGASSWTTWQVPLT